MSEIEVNAESVVILNLESLAGGPGCFTPEWGASLAQAASVALEGQGHQRSALMGVDGAYSATFEVAWTDATPKMRRCYGDPDEATELGACGIASLLLQALADLTIVDRSRKGGGYDYWLGRADDTESLFQNKIRLEVTGIGRGPDSVVKTREQQKHNRLARFDPPGGPPHPAVVVVVEFGAPRSRVTRR